MNIKNKIHVSVPGRVCLFGEHQDYLGLPVMTAAINLRIHVSGERQAGREIRFDLPDLNAQDSFLLPPAGEELSYTIERDYLRSTYNLLLRQGMRLETGLTCTIKGNIPINSGTSSSSAMILAWARLLLLAADGGFDCDDTILAHLAYLAEVEEFGEPGGMMDHYATALGGIRYMEFGENVKQTPLENRTGAFVLGDSRQPKDTKNILHRVKQGILDANKKIREEDPIFDLATIYPSSLSEYHDLLPQEQRIVLEGAVINRDITREARQLVMAGSFDHQKFGELLNRHHEILDKKLGISTTKINRMLQNALQAGALGGKINGSGGGGCMFVYAPENTENVAKSIEEAGGTAYIVNVDEGIKIH